MTLTFFAGAALGAVAATLGRFPRGEPGVVDRAATAAQALIGGGEAAGRRAETPAGITPRGWRDILWRTWSEIDEDRVLAVAAGVSFYALIALVPAIASFVALYGLIADRATASTHLAMLAPFTPPAVLQLIADQLTRLTQTGETKLGLTLLFGLGLSLWSANAGMKAMLDALNVAYNEREKRGFVRLNLISLAFTLGMFGFVILAILVVGALPLVLKWFIMAGMLEWVIAIGRWPLIVAALMLMLTLLYRFGPSRVEARWVWLSPGAVSAALVWMVYSIAFSWYVTNFGDYDAAYGSLGAVVALLLWMWLSVVIVLAGAELNCEVERQTFRDTTIGPDQPIGLRGANAADVKPA